MPKKKSSGTHYVSKGERPNVNRKTLNGMRAEYRGSLEQLANKLIAWRKKRRVMLTIENPAYDPAVPCNNRFIRVEAREVWGNPEPPKKKQGNARGS